jgi:hypothetical protein
MPSPPKLDKIRMTTNLSWKWDTIESERRQRCRSGLIYANQSMWQPSQGVVGWKSRTGAGRGREIKPGTLFGRKWCLQKEPNTIFCQCQRAVGGPKTMSRASINTCHLPDEPCGPLERAFHQYSSAYYPCIIQQK